MQDENKLETFRKSLEKANYAVPDSATFAETLNDPVKSKTFHEALLKDNYDVPEDYETFSSSLGLKKKDASEYFFPAKGVLDEMFANVSTPEVSERPPDTVDTEKFKTPDLTLKTPEFKGAEEPNLTQIVSNLLAKDRIEMHAEEYKKEAETRISEIDKKIASLPQDNTEMLPAMNFSGGLILPTRPVSEEKARLLKEKDDLRMAITKPDKLTYILGRAYNQSLMGLADNIMNGKPRAPEEWLQKYDASTLTDITATALGFMLDMPFFGGMGKVGGEIGKAAAKPFVERAMVRTTERMIKAGIPEATAKELVLKGAENTAQAIERSLTSRIAQGIGSSSVSLGSYGAVGETLRLWSQPNADFDDIKWSQVLKRGGKDFLLGVGVGGLGIGSSIIASKASGIANATARIGTKAGVTAGGLTAESALFAYGGALLDGRKLNDVTGKEFAETVALLGMLKVSNVAGKIPEAIADPKKAAIKIYQSLKYSPNKPGVGPFEVDIEPWEIDAIGGKDYKTVMDILSKDDAVLGDIMKSDKVPALLKQRLLWGSRGVGIEDINIYADKVVANGEYIDIYNKEGVLVDKRKALSKEEAEQVALETGLQLEDNKMQMKASAPDTDKVKIVADLKSSGIDLPVVLGALDKPVMERTPEESKIVGDFAKRVPSGDLKIEDAVIVDDVMPSVQKPGPKEYINNLGETFKIGDEVERVSRTGDIVKLGKITSVTKDDKGNLIVDTIEQKGWFIDAIRKTKQTIKEQHDDIGKSDNIGKLAENTRKNIANRNPNLTEKQIDEFLSNQGIGVILNQSPESMVWAAKEWEKYTGEKINPFERKISIKEFKEVTGIDLIELSKQEKQETPKKEPKVEPPTETKPDIGEYNVKSLNERAQKYGLADRDMGADIFNRIGNAEKIGLEKQVANISPLEWEQMMMDAADLRSGKTERRFAGEAEKPEVKPKKESLEEKPIIEEKPKIEVVAEVKPEVPQKETKPTAETKTETPEVIDKETAIKINKKFNQQKAIKGDKIFQEQKTKLLDDLISAEDILLGQNKENARKIEKDYTEAGVDQETIDANIRQFYQHPIGEIPKDILGKLEKIGIREKEGKLVVDIFGDGSVEVGDIRTALHIIEKGFPKRITPKSYLEGPSKPRPSKMRDIAESYGSLEEAERRVKLAEENLETANKSTNKGLQKTMQEQLNEAKQIHAESKNIDFTAIQKEKKINDDWEFNALWNEFKDHFTYDNIYKNQLYDIIEKQGRPKDLTYDTVQPLVIKDKLEKEGRTIEDAMSGKNSLLESLEKELQDTFGRKDDKGLRQPKNKSEEWKLKSIRNQIDKTRSELIGLQKYGKEIIKLQKPNEKPNKTSPVISKTEESKLPTGTEVNEKPIVTKSEEKPIGESVIEQKVEEPEKPKVLPKLGEEVMVEFQGKKHKESVLHIYDDGRIDVDYFGRKTLTPDRYERIEKSEAPKKIEVTKEGVKYGGKTYTERDQVQEDFENGLLTIPEQRPLLHEVGKYEDAQSGVEPLAWDKKLPISTAEDPNFKESDLNDAISVRNIAQNAIKNFGKIEGVDVKTGFITRFSRKARAIFNPVSGIIRVRNVRDLRALTHEIGHWLDFNIFDIRGITGARKSDPNLGIGVDFNGKTYSTIEDVEKAMKFRAITVSEGNYLLEKVKIFEKQKSKEKYSEIIEQGTPVSVKINGKTYKSVDEINDALIKGTIKTTQASKKIVEFNNLNKNLPQKLDKLKAKFGDEVVAGVLQRVTLKKEFKQLLRDVGYPSEKREEGIAEFVYNYVYDPSQLIRSTPNALAWFEKMLDNAPVMKKALHSLREDFAKYNAQDILTKMAGEMKVPEPEQTSWIDGIINLKDKLGYSLVNHLQFMEKMTEKWMAIPDIEHPSYKNPWISAKELIGIDGRVQQFLLYHPFYHRGNDILLREDVKGFIPIIKKIVGTQNYTPYQEYLIALDSMESHNRGKSEQAYFDKDMASDGIIALEKRYGAKELQAFQRDFQRYNEALLDFYVESGMISKETADYWKQEHQNYVPLKRIAEVYESFKGNTKVITRDMLPEADRAIFSRKGSEKQLKDIFDSVIDNTYRILNSSETNIHNHNMVDMLFDFHNYNKKVDKGGAVIEEIDARDMEASLNAITGEVVYSIKKNRPKNFRAPKGRIMAVYENGVPRFYDIVSEYYDPLFQSTLEAKGVIRKIIKAASLPSRWLQAGAVIYDPTFPIRNIFRDQMSAWFYSKHGYLPTDFFKGLMSAIKKDTYYQKWLASGGDQSFLVSADQMITEDFVSHKVGTLARRKFDAYKRNPLLALQDFSKASEIGTRLGAFRTAYRKTGDVHQAAIESRDVSADYGIKGAALRRITMFYPFLNPRIQHMRMMTNAMKHPASFMLKGMAITVPSIINWLWNNQDEESKELYQSLPPWRRVGLFNIRIPGTKRFFPIPKGFFGVMFGSSVESLLDSAFKDDPRVTEELAGQLFKEFSPVGNWSEFIPFPIRPYVEEKTNIKGYTNKPIVSESMKSLTPPEQFYNSTPEIIKKMGEALNWSPVKIEHYFKSYTGGAGIGAVNILDEVLQSIGLVEKKPEDRFTTLSRMPVMKAFLTEKPIGLSSGYISDFYERLDKVEKVNASVTNFLTNENIDGLDKFMSVPENKRMFSFYDYNSTALNSFRKALSFARESTYAVMKDDLLSNKEKQRDIANINNIIQESALKFKDAYENNRFFNYGKAMDEIITKMKESTKETTKEIKQQKNVYNPYWLQLRQQNKDVFDRLREFDGLRDIEQTRTLTQAGEKVNLELEDVRRFNETVVKRYGEKVKNMIGTDPKMYENYQKITNPSDATQTQLKQILDSAWEAAMAQTKADFKPTYTNEK